MNFDDDYRRVVLEPARAAGDAPPEDLRVRYALPDPLTPAGVAAAVKQVRQCWRRARGQLKYRRLVDRLEAEHRELAPLFAAAERGDLSGLAERLRGGEERGRRRRTQARARLADAAGTLHLVTPAELEGIARDAGVAAGELAALAREDRIEVRVPDALPAAAPYAAFRNVRASLDVLGHRHLAAFVFGPRLAGPMRVLDGFAAPGVVLDRAAVEEAAAGWARRSRDTSTTHAGTVLAALRAGDPAELVRYDLVERLRERLAQRASERALLRYAMEDLGVEPGDARRLVFAVLRETAPGGGLEGRLRALLDGGEVHAAAELANASQDGGELPEGAAVLAAEARQRVATAVRLREAAAAEDDPDRAWRLLADALRLVRDLPGAAEHQRRLAPHPVPELRADIDGAAVRLSWDASPSTAGEVLYHVVRRLGRPPRNAADGDPLPGPRDDRPPANRPLFYAVVAVRGEAASPPTVTGPVVVRPEPADVRLSAGDGGVTGRWRCPPDAARVQVVRGGRRVPATRDGFTDRVPNGVTYHYRVCAVYLDEAGEEVATPGVRVSVTPSAPPDPVFELSAEPDPDDPGLLLVRFAPPAHGDVELVLTEQPPPWPRSALVPIEEVWRHARRLTATPSPAGLAVRPGAGGWLLAVSVAEGTAAIGAYHRHVNLPAPRRLLAERRGGRVHVGFDWPEGVAEVELTWRVGAGRIATGHMESMLGTALGAGGPERRLVTRAHYDTQGGVNLPVPEDEAVEVAVASSGLLGGSRVTGPAVTARVGSRTVVHYDVARGGPPWKRSLTIRLTAGQPVRVARLDLVVRAGRVMPHQLGDGDTLCSWEQVSVPGELSVELPSLSGPYWLRCFADDDVVELSDPPVRRLQVTR
ncbi:hypothetical protein [Actinomadura parmotrematis]|uniref:SaeA fourth Fn3-like domain-containing protein n=1 Tax=Actinomadura parmotrematis TaxID=2864039 RepID=A0ABS7FYV6_9ACTN|nr:hypothetical protein [Actinomadura parmotrematis]MBW8485456.1 hypothetical protein [Actinomadura parmotrematis]